MIFGILEDTGIRQDTSIHEHEEGLSVKIWEEADIEKLSTEHIGVCAMTYITQIYAWEKLVVDTCHTKAKCSKELVLFQNL